MSAIKYYPYGVSRNSQGTLGTDKLFTGQRLDATGLYYYGARYYDPEIGRFISADTFMLSPSNPQGLNRYTYVFNNPLKHTDPTGNWVPPDQAISSINTIVTAVGNGLQVAQSKVVEIKQAAVQKAGEIKQAAMSASGVAKVTTVSPADLTALPPPVSINEPINIVEVRKDSLLDAVLLCGGDFAGTSRYPAGIFVAEGTISYSPSDLVSNSTMKEEFRHWEDGWGLYPSWIGGTAEASAVYGPQYWYRMNPVEREAGLYGGRLTGNEPIPDPWWNPMTSSASSWWGNTTSEASNWGQGVGSSISNWVDSWW